VKGDVMPRVGIGMTNLAILNGDEDLSLWSEEELIRGQRRAKNGKWQGRKPKVVPVAVHNELVRRRLSQAGELLRESLVDAVTLLREVVQDEEAQYSDRIKAATLIMDRVMGKAAEHVTLTLQEEPPWAKVIRAAIGPMPLAGPNDKAHVIDAESWEQEN
jgi:hypothetical protein